jgi:hypothetical protein
MDPKQQQTEEERKRNAPPPTHTREEKAPTEIRDAALRELRSKLAGLAPGRIVHAVLRVPYNAGEAPITRPAIVVSLSQDVIGVVNLQIFTNGIDDARLFGDQNVAWGPGYLFSETHEPGTWHWPERI